MQKLKTVHHLTIVCCKHVQFNSEITVIIIIILRMWWKKRNEKKCRLRLSALLAVAARATATRQTTSVRRTQTAKSTHKIITHCCELARIAFFVDAGFNFFLRRNKSSELVWPYNFYCWLDKCKCGCLWINENLTKLVQIVYFHLLHDVGNCKLRWFRPILSANYSYQFECCLSDILLEITRSNNGISKSMEYYRKPSEWSWRKQRGKTLDRNRRVETGRVCIVQPLDSREARMWRKY